ncbi:MAG: carboxyl transferase domain-containing protein [Candidatus Binatia bacterium]|nr:carboxyl transferase domain-containing protein [Candidatus Binatia bacterium]
MSWKKEVDQIEQRRRLAKELGGTDAVDRQHERGRLTVRERIDGLIDQESFREVGPIAGYAETNEDGSLKSFQPGNYVLGIAKVGGRPCVVGGEDFTQRGGSPTPAGLRKSVYAEELACKRRLPLVRFLEGGGGSVRGSGKRGPSPDPVYTTHRFVSIARVLETAPVVSAALGAVAGFPAARLVASHFAIMTRDTAQVLIGGPALVERALGEKKTKEELGGAKVHERSSVVDAVAADENEVFNLMRGFLSYMPTNVSELPPVLDAGDDPERCEEALLAIIPRNRRRVYDARKLVRLVVDKDSFFEMTPLFGRPQITALARLNGTPVGVVANDPFHLGGSMTAHGAQKFRRFVRLCETFHLPILSFVDQPGFMIGSEAESTATIRLGMEAISETVRSTVPWASVIVRKSYGVAAAAHYGPDGTVFAWPSAERGALPLEGGVAVAFRREIAEAPDPDAKRKELEELLSKGRTPFPSADFFSVHDLIDPRRTRPALCEWLESVQPSMRARVTRL